eukprot:12021177-Alexandrium_andersonii.AAC.1
MLTKSPRTAQGASASLEAQASKGPRRTPRSSADPSFGTSWRAFKASSSRRHPRWPPFQVFGISNHAGQIPEKPGSHMSSNQAWLNHFRLWGGIHEGGGVWMLWL